MHCICLLLTQSGHRLTSIHPLHDTHLSQYDALSPELGADTGLEGSRLRRASNRVDPIDPVNGAARPDLDQKLLARFPEGYRHLAYLQTRIGYKVRDDVPGPEGAELDVLYALGASWLSGGKLLLTKRAA